MRLTNTKEKESGMRDLIFIVCESFYKKAVYDVMIGYHFDKFRDQEVLHHHLERITTFWEMQFTGAISKPLEGPGFRLMMTHLQINPRKGELGRWKILFHQTLDDLVSDFKLNGTQQQASEIVVIADEWKKKISFFEERFNAHPMMFK